MEAFGSLRGSGPSLVGGSGAIRVQGGFLNEGRLGPLVCVKVDFSIKGFWVYWAIEPLSDTKYFRFIRVQSSCVLASTESVAPERFGIWGQASVALSGPKFHIMGYQPQKTVLLLG